MPKRSNIERGKEKISKSYQDFAKRAARHHANQQVKNFVREGEDDLILDDEFNRVKQYKKRASRISPVRTFLLSKIGQKWEDVISDLKTKTGEIGENILREVEKLVINHRVDDKRYDLPEKNIMTYSTPTQKDLAEIRRQKAVDHIEEPILFIDENQMVQVMEDTKDIYQVSAEDLKKCSKFLDNRVIAVNGNQLHWCFPKEGIYKIEYSDVPVNSSSNKTFTNKPFDNSHLKLSVYREEFGTYRKHEFWKGFWDTKGLHWKESPVENFVARSEFSTKDYEEWEEFPEKIKTMMLELGKGIVL